MNGSFDIPTSLVLFWVVNACFTVCLLLLQANRIWDGARYWIAGNLTMLALLTLLAALHGTVSPSVTVLPAVLIMLSQLLKLAAMLCKHRRPWTLAIGCGLMAAGLATAWAFDGDQDGGFGLRFAAAILGGFISLQGLACFTQPRWRRLRGSTLFIVASGTISLLLFATGLGGLGIPKGRLIIQAGPPAQTFLLISCTYFIVTHISLVAMLMARLNRIMAARQMREHRQFRLARQAEIHAQKMSKLAEEKQSLLDVLIHEVRQPLNNAQAALQDVLMTVGEDSRDHRAGRRLQAIIDQVVLSLSNAIIGASVLERRSQSILVPTDIAMVCQLASSDVGPDWAERIDLLGGDEPIFAPADPVLLRLALRNLIDNALRHSPPDRKVKVIIARDDKARVVGIRVANWPARAFAPNPDLFERGVRGDNPYAEGKGLGLYIVREIALIHRGSVQARITPEGLTEFEMSVPI